MQFNMKSQLISKEFETDFHNLLLTLGTCYSRATTFLAGGWFVSPIGEVI